MVTACLKEYLLSVNDHLHNKQVEFNVKYMVQNDEITVY